MGAVWSTLDSNVQISKTDNFYTHLTFIICGFCVAYGYYRRYGHIKYLHEVKPEQHNKTYNGYFSVKKIEGDTIYVMHYNKRYYPRIVWLSQDMQKKN